MRDLLSFSHFCADYEHGDGKPVEQLGELVDPTIDEEAVSTHCVRKVHSKNKENEKEN